MSQCIVQTAGETILYKLTHLNVTYFDLFVALGVFSFTQLHCSYGVIVLEETAYTTSWSEMSQVPATFPLPSLNITGHLSGSKRVTPENTSLVMDLCLAHALTD